jgi:hypothetical protein
VLQLREILNQIWSKTHLFSKKKLFFAGCLLFVLFQLNSCVNESEKKSARNKIDYIHRIQVTSDSIPAEIAGRGEVLTSYSDCYTCHKIDERSMGPAFKDIAKRYPTNLQWRSVPLHQLTCASLILTHCVRNLPAGKKVSKV